MQEAAWGGGGWEVGVVGSLGTSKVLPFYANSHLQALFLGEHMNLADWSRFSYSTSIPVEVYEP